jgi:hypothetical protein
MESIFGYLYWKSKDAFSFRKLLYINLYFNMLKARVSKVFDTHHIWEL